MNFWQLIDKLLEFLKREIAILFFRFVHGLFEQYRFYAEQNIPHVST